MKVFSSTKAIPSKAVQLGGGTRLKPNEAAASQDLATTEENLWPVLFEDSTRPLNIRSDKAKLNYWQEVTTGPGSAHLEPGGGVHGGVSHEDELGVDRLWQMYFEDPTGWWDNRNSKLQAKSPDFRHKATKKALWIDSWDTPKWVTEILGRETRPTGDGEDDGVDGMNSGIAASLKILQKDVFSWTARILQKIECGQSRQALKIYLDVRQVGLKPSSYTIVAALKACRSLRNLESTKQIHADIVETGFQSDVNVGNMLVDVYAKCGCLEEARRVFEKMPCRDVVSWNSMISGYTQMGEGEEALQLYARMQQEGGAPNDRTFVGALKACSILVTKEGDKSRLCVKTRCLDQICV